MKNKYMNGRKVEETADGDKIIKVPVEGITVIGVENPEEVVIKPNAPEPFVYGVSKICTNILEYEGQEPICTIYDVRTGEYLEGQSFPGWDWLDAEVETMDTSTYPDVGLFQEIKLLKQKTIKDKKDKV